MEMYNQKKNKFVLMGVSFILLLVGIYASVNVTNNSCDICQDKNYKNIMMQKYDDDALIIENMKLMNMSIVLKDNEESITNIKYSNLNYNENKRKENTEWPKKRIVYKYKYFNTNNHKLTSDYNNSNKSAIKINLNKQFSDAERTNKYLNEPNTKRPTLSYSLQNMKDKTNYEYERQRKEKLNPEHNIINMLQQHFIHSFAIKYKQISHVTLFTCRKQSFLPLSGQNKIINFNSPIIYKQIIFFKHLLNFTTKNKLVNSLMLKIVQIDDLQEKSKKSLLRFGSSNIFPWKYYTGNNNLRSTAFTENLLDEILSTNSIFKHVVIVNMECCQASRDLLQMASKKSLFNGMYHWLLLAKEKYYNFNRQTELDGTNPVDNDNAENEKSKIPLQSNTTHIQYNHFMVVNDNLNNTSNLSYITVYKQQQKPLLYNAEYSNNDVYDNVPSTISSKLQTHMKNTTNNSTESTESAESIEKFLEKLNININSEITLAKLHSMQQTHSILSTTDVSYSEENQCKYNSDVNISSRTDYCYDLYDIWNPGQQYGGKLNVTLIGNFTLQRGLQLEKFYQLTSTVRRRINMKLAQIRCMVVIIHKNHTDSLEHYLTNTYDPHIDSMNRFNYALISLVKDMFNFSMITSKISSWGYLKNGRFDGMIGALMRNQTDIGGSPIFFRLERAKVIDYTVGTWIARPCFIFRHPRSTQKDRIVFLQPFTNDVWLCTALFAGITIALLWILTTVECNSKKINGNCKVINTKKKQAACNNGKSFIQQIFQRLVADFCSGFSFDDNDHINKSNKQLFRINAFLEAFLFYVGSICQQGSPYATNFLSGRCIIITSILFSFAVYQFYLASIVGTLLMEKPKTVRTLRDLIETSLEIGIEDIPYNRDYFLRTKDPVAQELYARKVTHQANSTFDTASNDNVAATILPAVLANLSKAAKEKIYRNILHSHETGVHAKTNDAANWYQPEFGVQKIKNGYFAFHVDVATAYKIIADTFTEKEICELTEIELFPMQKMMSIVQKNSPLRKTMSYGMRRAIEVGLVDYQRKIWHASKPRCVKQVHTEDLQVDLQTFRSALLLFTFGSILSLLILCLEIAYQKLYQY